ncbi:alpha-amylase family glycosyl hydrolase [Parabacteroides sp. Marseille-P3160]|uniref:alpha-amylase family glycosyl hydrolase n=1 Tax=Parabacteroides sp. Marseille-P3160 TaxID=1917887 RepID=UPI0009B98A10|nr:alpha-amylase family glycosyl hydrolase [Parabacteroides sp. Marseille-P3160]
MEQNKKVIYQAFPRWFGNDYRSPIPNGTISDNGVGKFSSFTPKALKAIRELGATDIWYTGVLEHATKTDYTNYGIRKDHRAIVKGKAGSPYAVKDYFDVDPDLADSVPGRISEFEALVKRTHDAGMKVIIDFVPNHVARQYYSDAKPPFIDDLGQHDDPFVAFAPNNNFYYLPLQTLDLKFGILQDDFEYSEFPARVTGNNCFSASPGKDDWYETIKLNYGVDYMNGGIRYFDPIPDTWTKMLQVLEFWTGKGVDGFRCDMAEMVPVEFWHWVIPKVKALKEVFFIAEVYNPEEYSNYIYTGGFDYLYDKVGLYDTLRKVICGQAPAAEITKCWQAVEGIQPHMLYFLENHDEQRIASDFFAGKAEAGIPGLLVSALMNTNPVLIYSGQELGERGMDEEGFSGLDGRTSIFDYWSVKSLWQWSNGGAYDGGLLPDEQKQLRKDYRKILNIASKEAAVTKGLFYDLTYANMANNGFNPKRQFAFIRKYENEVLLVVVNFDTSRQSVRIRIPEEAFTFLGIEDNQAAHIQNLLSGKKEGIATLTSAYPYELTLPPYGGALLKFTYDTETK